MEDKQGRRIEKENSFCQIEKDNESPSEILGVGAEWALSFTFESIKNAIDRT